MVTIDNIRRTLSSFFAWLENEDYIIKSPVRRIHKVKATKKVKETFTDENLEKLRDTCSNVRDLAVLELLISTGMRVGELTRLNIVDMNFQERSCIVLGKGNSEREVYFSEKSKIISILIDIMKTQEKQIFTMFYYKGNKVKDIAKLLNITETKVKVTLYRLRKQVKKNFKERGYDCGK